MMELQRRRCTDIMELIMARILMATLVALLMLFHAAASASSEDIHTARSSSSSALLPWTPDRYPQAPDDVLCQSSNVSPRFCDPDSVLTDSDRRLLGKTLAADISNNRKILLPAKCTTTTTDVVNDEEVPVQYSVALVRKMDLVYGDSPEKAAEVFARHVHDTWGVGVETEACGGTGILLFLSDLDRSIYISRGSALESVLTNRRIDKTIMGMKPSLSEGRYGDAILNALEGLDAYLAAGPPDWKERTSDFIVDYFGLVMIVGIFGFVGQQAIRERKHRREYARVASQLDELDQARAEALKGRFQAKSCPICLESFKGCEFGGETGSHRDTDAVATDENEDETKQDAAPQLGSDGLPLKLLRCGHVFDESCWAEWISSGHHGKVDKCPICQQDVGKSQDDSATAPTAAPTAAAPADETTTTMTQEEQNAQRYREEEERRYRQEEERNRALRQYTRDRNFRLMRLGSRYPQYVGPQQIQRWTQVGYDGPLARDPGFVNNDPVRRQAAASSGGSTASGRHGGFSSSSSSRSGFGGGSSGGGRGSRW